MIEIKDHKVLRELMFATFDAKLVALATWCISKWPTFRITSGYREGDPGVHGQIPCRGLDVSSKWASDPLGTAKEVNAAWQYDPSRPEKLCCLYHKTEKGEWHFHLQVHPKTVYLDGIAT